MFMKQYIFILLAIMLLSLYIRIYSFHWPYLRNIDSYAFYRQMQYIVDTGLLPQRDMLATAPVGWPLKTGPQFYQYLGAYSYIFVSWFLNISLFQWLIWLPAILITLAAIPAYYIGKTLYDKNTGILSTIFILFSVSVLSRSLGGDPDSDAIVMLWPMINIAFYLIAIKIKSTKKSLIYHAITGFTLALFAFTWPGYWYVYWLLFGFIIIYSLFKFSLEKKIPKKEILGFLLLTIILLILGCAYFGYWFISNLFYAPFETAGLFSPTGGIKGETREFPNVYVSVAELMTGGSIKDIINHVSNINVTGSVTVLISPFMLAIYGLIFLAYLTFFKKKCMHSFILIFLWLIGSIYSTIIAVRFGIFLIPPIAFSAAIFLSVIVKNIKLYVEKLTKKDFTIGVLVMIFIFIWIFYLEPAFVVSSKSGPVLNENWWQALNWIKNNTEECTVVATYWDPGHFITGIANRPVVFDGATQNALLYLNEKDEPVKETENYTSVRSRIKDIATTLFTSNETLAIEILKRYRFKNCSQPMIYIASSDLIFKSQWWSYFATWDPVNKGKKYIYIVLSMTAKKPLIKENVIAYVYQISPNEAFLIYKKNNTYIAKLQSGNQFFDIEKFWFLENTLKKVEKKDAQIKGILLAIANFQQVIYIPPELENSIFTKMMFFNGYGLEHFDLMKNFGNEVKIYKVCFDMFC